MSWRKTTDTVHTVKLSPRLARLFWSERHADVGTKVTLTVETEWIGDDTELELTIHTDAAGTTAALVTETAKVKAGAAVLEDWEVTVPDPLDIPTALYFKASCKKPELAAMSPALAMEPFVLSA